MFSTSSVLFTIIVIFWIHWLWKRRKFYLMVHRIGGPVELPLIGSALHFRDGSKTLLFLRKLQKEYGNIFSGFLGLKPCLIVSEPKVIEEIFTNELLIDKMDIYNVLNDFAYKGLFSSPKSKWQHSRKHINKAFTNKVLLSFYNIFNKQGLEFCNVIEKYAGKGEIDVYPYIEKVQLDTACLTTMGQETNFLRGHNSELLEAYTELLHMFSKRLFNPLIMNDFIFKYLYPRRKKYDQSLNKIRSNTLKLIEQKYADVQKAAKDGTIQDRDSSPEDDINITKSKSIFIDIMVKEYITGNFTWDDIQIEADTMILAAYETTTNALFTTLYLLAIYPEYQEKLFEEIISVTTTDDVIITPEHVKQYVYIDMIMNETMRLISPVPLVGRDATEDIMLDNYFIPKGTNVIVDIFNLHRREDIWGPVADRIFNPDNFSKENLANKHPYSFIPFTKGIRTCVGWRYAIISFKVMLSIILKKYKVSSTFKFSDLKYTAQLALKFKENPKISFELRKH